LLLSCILFFSLTLSCERTFSYDPEDIPPFEGLSAPEPGKGYQIHVPPFPVPAQYEREIYIRMDVGNEEDIYVNTFNVLCRPGTHHMIAYGYRNENNPEHPAIGVMRDQNLPDGRANFNLTMGSGAMYCGAQEDAFDLQLPPGIAMKIPAGATIDVNSHYFNFTDEVLFGEVFLNMITIPADSVKEVLKIDDISNINELFLPPQKATTIVHREIFGRNTQIRQMFAHMHKRGYKFEVSKFGGQQHGDLLYVSLDYRHPPYKFFDPPLEIKAGEGLITKVYYNNETDREISFGVTSEDEMGILFYSKIKE
ncbi:MAG: hypothetical protein AAF696_11165, partial [Bacteroidota bacterium]